jgi:hypothetical protein
VTLREKLGRLESSCFALGTDKTAAEQEVATLQAQVESLKQVAADAKEQSLQHVRVRQQGCCCCCLSVVSGYMSLGLTRY